MGVVSKNDTAECSTAESDALNILNPASKEVILKCTCPLMIVIVK